MLSYGLIFQTARQNPELIGQLRQQLQTITDLVNLHQQQTRGQQNGAGAGFAQDPQPNFQETAMPPRQFSIQRQQSNAAEALDGPSTSRQGDVVLDLELHAGNHLRNLHKNYICIL